MFDDGSSGSIGQRRGSVLVCPSTRLLVFGTSSICQDLVELAYNLLQRIFFFVEQWLHAHHIKLMGIQDCIARSKVTLQDSSSLYLVWPHMA